MLFIRQKLVPWYYTSMSVKQLYFKSEKKSWVPNQKNSQTSIILLFTMTFQWSERIIASKFSLYSYLQSHHCLCLLDWLWTLQTSLHTSHSRWALRSVLPSLLSEGKQSQWHIHRAPARWPGILLKMFKLPQIPIYNPTKLLDVEASIFKYILWYLV